MKKLSYLIVLALVLGLVLTGCSLLSNISQVPDTGQSGITYLTKTIDPPLVLAARWDFNTITAGTVADLSGNSNTGNVFGATLEDSGHPGYGNALSFNGVYDCVEVAHSSSLNITGTGITLEAWINADEFPTSGRDTTINKTNAYALHVADGGKVRVYLGPLSLIQTDTVVLSINTWHHIAGTYDGANVRIYVDGDLKKTVAKTGNQATSSNPMVIGKRDPGATNTDGTFKGFIDEVRIWSSALADTQLDDMTPPVIDITTPHGGDIYLLDQIVTAEWSADDGEGTGVASESETVPIDTSTVGEKTFEVTATDYAMNEAIQKVTYYVHNPFIGFLPPVEENRVFKVGSTIPVKFQLQDADGNYITDADAWAKISLQKLDNSDVPEGSLFEDSSGAANSGNLFRYDPTSNQYIFNLSTKGTTAGKWRIEVTLEYGATYSVDIYLK